MTGPMIAIKMGTKAAVDQEGRVEGWLAPFGGPLKGNVDLDGEAFGPETDFALDYYAALPVLYGHGQDDEIAAAKVGEISIKEIRDQGLWVQGQLDRQGQYYAALRELADKGDLYWSSGALSHLVRKDGASIKAWPVAEATLTVAPANPLATASIKGWLPEGTTQGDLDDGDFAWLADDTKLPDSERRKLPYKVHGKVNEAGWRAAWTRAHQSGTDFAGGTSQEAVIAKLLRDKPKGVEVATEEGKEAALPPPDRATKQGRRNSAADMEHIQAMHDHSVALGAECPEATGKSLDAPPAPVLAVKVGNDVETVSDDDLARLADMWAESGIRAIKEALHIYD